MWMCNLIKYVALDFLSMYIILCAAEKVEGCVNESERPYCGN